MFKLPISFFRLIYSSLIVLVLYFILYFVEFFITEIYIIVPAVDKKINTYLLVFFIFVISIAVRNKTKFRRLNSIILATVIVALLFFNNFLFQEKFNRRDFPKIISVRPNSFIQQEEVVIKGVNFGLTFEKGRVLTGKDELIVKDWKDNEIIAESGVPSSFGKNLLYVVTKELKVSKGYPVFIEDPDTLKNLQEVDEKSN